MKTPGEVPGLSCSRGKPITTTGAAWLPVNNMTHKLIMPVSLLTPFSSLLPPARSHSITPMTATPPPVWCPAHFPSAAHSFQSRSPLNDVAEEHQALLERACEGGVGSAGSVGEFSVRRQKMTFNNASHAQSSLCSAPERTVPGALVKTVSHPLCFWTDSR